MFLQKLWLLADVACSLIGVAVRQCEGVELLMKALRCVLASCRI